MAELNFENIQINPATVQWGNQSMQKVTVSVATGLGGKTFNLNAPDEAFYVWLNTGADTDPAVVGKTGIEVDISLATTKLAVAQALATDINAEGSFNAKAYEVNGVVYCIIQCKDIGAAAAASNGTPATSFAFAEIRAGSLLDIGLTEDFEVGLATSMLDVKASQYGTTILERLRNGMNIDNIAINMKESIAAKIQAIMEPHYPAFTPAGGTAVQGVGNSKDFLNVSVDSAKLIFHPIKIAANDLSEDWAFFRACPLMKKLNFSGESEQMISVEFSILPDVYLVKEAAHGVYGDHSQNFLK